MKKRLSFVAVALLAFVQQTRAQGVEGIDAASSELTTYVDPIGTLIIVIGAIVGLVGGVRVFIKWNSGDQDVQKSIMGWMGSCVFLMLVGVVVKAFFGV
ncbi:DUF4134 domain-containing protein [Pontibacter toksunensis]|uniref:DUF4134 domain-containing protein n=1 Tax=Pontibacter toksunensis TaxID=1332631 RepID=A0ABW6BYB1_9BACT